MRRQQTQSFLVIGKRQEVVEVFARVRGPCEMPRHQHGIDAVDERAHPLEMSTVDAPGAADRYADGVDRNRIVPARFEQELGGVRIGEKILRMNLEPARRWQRGDDLRDVRQPQADARSGRRRALRRCRHGALRRGAAHNFGFVLPPWMRLQ